MLEIHSGVIVTRTIRFVLKSVELCIDVTNEVKNSIL